LGKSRPPALGAILAVKWNRLPLPTALVDLVLMDINMPEMDGLEAAEAIRRKEVLLGTHVPIVALTASALDTRRKECIKAGMDDFLTKPIVPTALDEVLSRYSASKYDAR
jgi:CheY-like chemotaxis protein